MAKLTKAKQRLLLILVALIFTMTLGIFVTSIEESGKKQGAVIHLTKCDYEDTQLRAKTFEPPTVQRAGR